MSRTRSSFIAPAVAPGMTSSSPPWPTIAAVEGHQPAWSGLTDVYGRPYDPQRALDRLNSAIDDSAAWEELWSRLYHQGGVGDVAYAVVPELVHVCQRSGVLEWRSYALVGAIDLAREAKGNPPIPVWIESQYSDALSALAELGRHQIERAVTVTEVRSILAILALRYGARLDAHFLLHYQPDELIEMEQIWKDRSRA